MLSIIIKSYPRVIPLMISILVIVACQNLSIASALTNTPSRWNSVSPSRQNSWLSLSKTPKILSSDETADATLPLMQLASAHITPQVLRCLVELGIPDIIGNDNMTIDEIVNEMSVGDHDPIHNCRIEKDALLRIMRLSATIGITIEELVSREHSRSDEQVNAYGLTPMGALLQTKQVTGQLSLASCVQHWTEAPLWNSWLHLPDYIIGEGVTDQPHLPFDRANGMSSDEYYGHDKGSLKIANEFVRTISDGEISAIVEGFEWRTLSGKTIVDVGGHNGIVIGAVAHKYPNIECICLDLPEVVASAAKPPPGVKLVGGDIMDPTSVPKCDAIFMKHILDKSMWDEEESVALLRSCHVALPRDGKVILGEAVLPNVGTEGGSMQLFMDVQFLLVGREGQRTESEWTDLARKAGFKIESINRTSSASCYIIVLTKAEA
mmetsp:Transcript_13519/g.15929  ORF Transcript_13519/g.15929 Transcript_13519/m.15929 type:complete len:436 (-) Transcript_13519:34-1341(-)